MRALSNTPSGGGVLEFGKRVRGRGFEGAIPFARMRETLSPRGGPHSFSSI